MNHHDYDSDSEDTTSAPVFGGSQKRENKKKNAVAVRDRGCCESSSSCSTPTIPSTPSCPSSCPSNSCCPNKKDKCCDNNWVWVILVIIIILILLGAFGYYVRRK